MPDHSTWTYGTHPTFTDHLFPQLVCRLGDENESPLIEVEAEEIAFTDYFEGRTSAPDFAPQLVQFTYDGPPLQELSTQAEISQRAIVHITLLKDVVENLPQLHGRVCDLVKAVRALRDEDFRLTETQMAHAEEWGQALRLGDFYLYIHDVHGGTCCDCQVPWWRGLTGR